MNVTNSIPALLKSSDGRFVAARQPDGSFAVSEFNGARRLEPRYQQSGINATSGSIMDCIKNFETIMLNGECLMWEGKGEFYTNCTDVDEAREFARMEDDGGASSNE